jgi:hypothetical protein
MGMAGDTRAAAALSPALRMALLTSTAVATALLATAAANAGCNPNLPADGDTATCTGTTNGQGPDAGVGYGSAALTNLHITVAPGASVTGTIIGIAFIDGTVISSGAITGGEFGISADNANVTNSGSIAGGNQAGISAAVSATVTNSGTITGNSGIYASVATVVNSGTIIGLGSSEGIYTDSTANVTNTGRISGGNTGIISNGSATVTNSGTITGNSAIVAFGGDVAVTNSGSITASANAIYATGKGTVTNSGKIIGTWSGVASVGDTNVSNTGIITSTDFNAIYSFANAMVNNAGTIASANGVAVGSAGTVTVTNSGTITGGLNGVGSDTIAIVANFGTITGSANGVYADTTTTVTNSGTIIGDLVGVGTAGISNVTNSGVIRGGNTGVGSDGFVTVSNSGTITGQSRQGIFGGINATVTNSGTITGGRNGVASNDTASVTNTGTIIGAQSGVWTYGTGIVTTSGFIGGGNGTAIQFNANGTAASDTLNILPGARFGGRVDFGGGADRVNFGPGNWVLDTAQYDAALSTVTTPGTPYFITPNQIIVADTSSFRMMKRAIMDITGWISSVLPDSPVFDPSALSGANAFASIDAPAPRFDDAFASFPSVLPRAPTPAFTGGTVNDAHGNAFWAKGFGGRRDQGAGDGVIAGITTGAGVAIGFDANVTSNTRLGAFVGGSDNDTRFDLNAGSIGIDAMFAGLYSRTLAGSSFLDLALIGATLDNESKRNINGVTPQTASARYDGWLLTPLLTFGHRFALPYNLTLTPAVKVRYVAAQFDGYTESGSNVNLTIAAQSFRGAEERAEVTLAGVQNRDGSRITFRGHAGLLARQYAGDQTVNIAFGGTSVLAAIGERDSYGLYAGGGFTWQTGNVALFASGEVTGMNDNSTIVAGKGGVRVVW